MSSNKTTKNAVIYARYSSHGQTEQSIEGQLRDCHAYAKREGLTVVGEYIDRALTGRSDDRPDFQRMIADAPKKQFQYVIVWKLDRFSRNRYDSAIYKARLKKYGVRVVSATENISDNPEGIMMEGMLESLAEYYSANLSKHVKRGLRESAIKGTYLGGIPPIGYKVVDKKLVIDEDKAPIIRYAFEEYAKGTPKKKILDALNARGVRNYYGRPLTMSCFQEAFHNKKYIGIYVQNGMEVTGGCPAIVDEKTFYKVQKLLEVKRHAPAAGTAKEPYLLQGKAYCGMCGTALVGDAGTSRTGKVHRYYACGKRKKRQGCKKLNEKKGYLEWYVVEQTVEYVLAPERRDFVADCIIAAYDKEFSDTRVGELEQRIIKIDGDVTKAVDASLEAPAKARQRYYEKIEQLEAQKSDMEADLARLRIANGIRYTKEQIFAWLETFRNGDLLDPVFQRRVIDIFINSIYLYDNKTVIYYNIRDGEQVSYIEMLDSSTEPPFGEGEPSGEAVLVSEGVASHFKNPANAYVSSVCGVFIFLVYFIFNGEIGRDWVVLDVP